MIKSLKKSLVLSCVLALLLPSVVSADMNVSRISGRDRYETAMKVQQKYFSKASGNLAIISSGTDFRTALYGSYMANALKVPFYSIPNTGISRLMLNELKEKGVTRVNIMGNYNQLNRYIDNSLKYYGIKVNRFYDKYENGYLYHIYNYIDSPIFETFHSGQPRGDINCGILINDKKFPDLLSSIPFVSILTREQGTFLGGIDGFYIDKDNPDSLIDGWRFIIGGSSSVPSYISTYSGDTYGLNLHSWDDENFDKKSSFYTGRIAGNNRYTTAVEIANAYKPVLNKDIHTVVLVDGTNYPDALASGTVATMNNGAILLTEPGKLNEDTKAFIQDNNIQNVIIVGGEKSVSKNVENELRGL